MADWLFREPRPLTDDPGSVRFGWHVSQDVAGWRPAFRWWTRLLDAVFGR